MAEADSSANVWPFTDLGDVTYLNVPTNDPRRHASHKTNKPDRHLTGSGQTVGARRRCATLRNGGSSSALETATRLPYSLVGLQHAEILDDVRRLIDPDDVLYRTIFDLDEVILSAVRDIQHHHHNRSVDSRPGSPRPISGRVAVGHTNSDCAVSNANLGATSVGPGQQQQQQPQLPQRQSQVNQINTASASHTSQSATVSNRTLSTPEGHHSSVTASFVPDVPPVPHVSERCECDGHGDCMLTNEDETWYVRQFEYDLILNPDINTISNLQWFYFRVANVESGVEYRFNVINCEKPGSQFTSGMQPLLFSVREALEGRPYWIRAGTRVNYYRNHFVRPVVGKHTADGSTYHTATFQIRFPHTGDVCYLAYHYPYTYTRLMTDIVRWQDQANELHSVPVYFRVQSLTSTLLENPVPLLTITAKTGPTDNCSTSVAETDGRKTTSDSVTKNKSPNRPYIFLTARVHSGEANSSWVMQGLVNRLLSDHPVAVQARQQFIFKIVPMLNPDGVICGNHRCSMAGKDLNRRWSNPSSFNHPTIYHTKKLLHLLHACNRSPFVFIDFHGHSRMKNIFLYGCSPFESWKNPDTDNPTYRGSELGEDPSYRYLATILDDLAPAFAKRSCMYVVNKAKETTARVAVWREFGVIRSYTIEASYCGVTQYAGQPSNPPTSNQPAVLTCSNQGHQMNLAHLQTFGAQLLNAFVSLPAHIERAAASDLKANMPDTTDQIGQGPSLTDETPDASCAKHHGSSFRSRRGSFSLDSACSLPSTISPVSSVHSLYSHSSASLSAQLSQSNSGHSSGSLTDG
ncbi:Cytosolic carboxypeptidase 1 [Fasciola hepatica]|uniref:Cytosolic carboxypeptidase 1 n=1 Tax=Fasciola hepatica TaxID=6192 RepID=A0A4E0RYT0_FASHE|nr:Cytosolic carboxypeptidase 1 [Fasciola hepatica]